MDKVVATDCENIHRLSERLASLRGRVCIMEICGTHTMSIARAGLRSLFPPRLKLISGPGCPVCVTDQPYMDQAIWLSRQPGVVIATYGDMVRVPGREGSLAQSRAAGASIEVVYSAHQAVELARTRPGKQIVFLAVGFETTAPGTALAIQEAREQDLKNFSALTAHKLVLPAMRALLAAGDVQVDAFLCPGHVSVILGYDAYREIAAQYGRPCVVAGFDPAQVLAAIVEILRQLDSKAPRACTVYPSVCGEGNAEAQRLLSEVFQEADASWRAIGTIPQSGMVLRPEYAAFDAARRFDLPRAESYELPGCRCGDVICGRCSPFDCGLFGRQCTPRDPVGPCMVSSEGACAAAYKYELPRAKTA